MLAENPFPFGLLQCSARLKTKEMGSRYPFICLYVWLEKYFSRGDPSKAKNGV